MIAVDGGMTADCPVSTGGLCAGAKISSEKRRAPPGMRTGWAICFGGIRPRWRPARTRSSRSRTSTQRSSQDRAHLEASAGICAGQTKEIPAKNAVLDDRRDRRDAALVRRRRRARAGGPFPARNTGEDLSRLRRAVHRSQSRRAAIPSRPDRHRTAATRVRRERPVSHGLGRQCRCARSRPARRGRCNGGTRIARSPVGADHPTPHMPTDVTADGLASVKARAGGPSAFAVRKTRAASRCASVGRPCRRILQFAGKTTPRLSFRPPTRPITTSGAMPPGVYGLQTAQQLGLLPADFSTSPLDFAAEGGLRRTLPPVPRRPARSGAQLPLKTDVVRRSSNKWRTKAQRAPSAPEATTRGWRLGSALPELTSGGQTVPRPLETTCLHALTRIGDPAQHQAQATSPAPVSSTSASIRAAHCQVIPSSALARTRARRHQSIPVRGDGVPAQRPRTPRPESVSTTEDNAITGAWVVLCVRRQGDGRSEGDVHRSTPGPLKTWRVGADEVCQRAAPGYSSPSARRSSPVMPA